MRPPPIPPLFPYTTLFRSGVTRRGHRQCPVRRAVIHRLLRIAGRHQAVNKARSKTVAAADAVEDFRSEEHTSELQSRGHLVCRLLLEKKNHPMVPTAQATA